KLLTRNIGVPSGVSCPGCTTPYVGGVLVSSDSGTAAHSAPIPKPPKVRLDCRIQPCRVLLLPPSGSGGTRQCCAMACAGFANTRQVIHGSHPTVHRPSASPPSRPCPCGRRQTTFYPGPLAKRRDDRRPRHQGSGSGRGWRRILDWRSAGTVHYAFSSPGPMPC